MTRDRAEALIALQACLVQLRFDAGMQYLINGGERRTLAQSRWECVGIAIALIERLLPPGKERDLFDIDEIDAECAKKVERLEADSARIDRDFQRAMAIACGNREWN